MRAGVDQDVFPGAQGAILTVANARGKTAPVYLLCDIVQEHPSDLREGEGEGNGEGRRGQGRERPRTHSLSHTYTCTNSDLKRAVPRRDIGTVIDEDAVAFHVMHEHLAHICHRLEWFT